MSKWKGTKTIGLSNDPAKVKEWQRRAQERAIAKMRKQGAKLAPLETGAKAAAPSGALRSGLPQKRAQNRTPRKNDSPWRAECIAARGEYCRCCGARPVQMDHIKPKGQGGKNDVENGLPLCPEHHRQKTDSEILIEWAWLDPDQLQYLASIGWVDWDDQGQPFGRGFKHFGTRPPRPGL